MERNITSFIPSIPLLVKMGLTVITAADGMMPGERYISYRNGPEGTATQWVCLWNDGTVQIMTQQPGWRFFKSTLGPFENEGAFLRALTN